MSRYERFKNHLRENKKAYFVGAGCLFVGAGITYLKMKNTDLLRGSGSELPRGSEARSFFLFSSVKGDQTTKAVTTIHTGTQGHPGFITRSIDTGELFESQGAAAKAFDISPALLSTHLNGKVDDVVVIISNASAFYRLLLNA